MNRFHRCLSQGQQRHLSITGYGALSESIFQDSFGGRLVRERTCQIPQIKKYKIYIYVYMGHLMDKVGRATQCNVDSQCSLAFKLKGTGVKK